MYGELLKLNNKKTLASSKKRLKKWTHHQRKYRYKISTGKDAQHYMLLVNCKLKLQ